MTLPRFLIMPVLVTAVLLVSLSAEAQGLRTLVRNRGAQRSPIVLRLLPAAPALSEQCTGNALTGTRGEAVTFTRSSSAVCTKSDGTLVTLASDKPRLEASGLLVEGAATNLALRSQEIDSASWLKMNAGTGSLPVVTQNAAAAPDGTTTAEQVVISAVTGATGTNNYSVVRQAVAVAAGAAMYSVWIRTASGTATTYIARGNAPADPSTTCNVTTTWTRFTMPFTSTGASQNFDIGVNLNNSSQSAQSSATLYVWGAQVETGTLATSYIATAGTQATRNAETVSVAQPSSLTDTVGCVAATVTPDAVSGTARVFGFGATNRMAFTAATTLTLHDGTNTASATVTSVTGRSTRVIGTWSGTALTVAESGSTAATATYDGALLSSPVYLLSDSAGANGINGHITNIIFGRTAGACQ